MGSTYHNMSTLDLIPTSADFLLKVLLRNYVFFFSHCCVRTSTVRFVEAVRLGY